MQALYIVIDTPAYKELVRGKHLHRFFNVYRDRMVYILLPYTLRKQYSDIVGIGIESLIRSIRYRVRTLNIDQRKEEDIVRRHREFLKRINEALKSRKHSAEDDARILVVTCIKTKNCGAKRLFVIALRDHVEHFRSAKNIVEQVLKTEECWFVVEDLERIVDESGIDIGGEVREWWGGSLERT